MRSVVHIGMHKTGTTSLQSTMYSHHKLLQSQGIYYPQAHTLWAGHHQIAWSLGVPHPRLNQSFDRTSVLQDYAEAAKDGTLVLSSEDFELAPMQAVQNFLSELSQFGAIEVVCYFRHPASWVESAFKWHAMKEPGRFSSIGHYIEAARMHIWLDYKLRFERWASPSARFTPRAYSPNTVHDFLGLLGAKDIPEANAENISPRNLTAKLVSELARNNQLDKSTVSKIDKWIRTQTEKDISLLSRAQYDALMSLVGPKNRMFSEQQNFLAWETLFADIWQPSQLSASEEEAISDSVRSNLERFRIAPQVALK